MAEIMDIDVDTTDDLDTTKYLELDVPETKKEEAEVKAAPEIPELPEKYRNKSVQDVVKMHQEAEKLASRQAQEVGEVRRLADELLKAQLNHKQPEKETAKEVDFFENPQEAIRQAVESNPKVIAAEQYTVQMQKELSRQKLAQKHPDLMSVVQDGEFIEWVKGSKVRMKLYQEADQNFDFDSGDELLSTYKQIKAINVSRETPKVSEIEKESRKQTAVAASVDTSGTNESTRKVYRRADLMRLMTRDPARYEAMSDEIYQAYAEGRVK